jgi:hypothetical protein
LAMIFAICVPSSDVAQLLYQWKAFKGDEWFDFYERFNFSPSHYWNSAAVAHSCRLEACSLRSQRNSTPNRTFACRLDLRLHTYTNKATNQGSSTFQLSLVVTNTCFSKGEVTLHPSPNTR